MTDSKIMTQPLRIELLSPALLAVVTFELAQLFAVIFAAAYPMQMADQSWRVQIAGLVMGNAATVSGLLVLMGTIALFSHRLLVLRIVAIVALVFAALLIPIGISFTLDVLEVRKLVPIDQLLRYKIDAIRSILTSLCLIPLLIWMGRRAFRASAVDTPGSEGDGIVVGAETQTPQGLHPRVFN